MTSGARQQRTKHNPAKPNAVSNANIRSSTTHLPHHAAPAVSTVQPAPKLLIKDKIVYILFSHARLLAAALARPHIAYEQGVLKGPLRGVNFPFVFLEQWVQGQLLELDEDVVWGLVRGVVGRGEEEGVYVVGCCEGDLGTLLHEYAHAVYYQRAGYRALALQLWEGLSGGCRVAVGKELGLRNYREGVWVDEFQAYVVENAREFGRKWVGELIEPHRKLKTAMGPVQLPTM